MAAPEICDGFNADSFNISLIFVSDISLLVPGPNWKGISRISIGIMKHSGRRFTFIP